MARRSHRANTRFRVLGALDALASQVTYIKRSKLTRFRAAEFLDQFKVPSPNLLRYIGLSD